MNCVHFAEILADFLDNTLTAAEQASAMNHLGTCANCRRLMDIVRGGVDVLPADIGNDLSNSILAATSGPACPRVESSLWGLTGRELCSEEMDLISGHLEHCPECCSSAEEIALLQETLAAMKDIDPGKPFTDDVIAATSGLIRFRPGFKMRLQAWWQGVVRRPLFSLEAAYIATLFMFFMFSPVLPFREIAAQKIPALWVRSKAPASIRIEYLASSVARSNLEFTNSFGGIVDHTERSVNAMFGRSMQAVESWERDSTADLRVFWQRLIHFTTKK